GEALHRRAADPEQGLLLPTTLPARARQDRREERRQDRGRDPQEEEQQLGVDRVRPCGVERRGQVVPHDTGAGQPRLEVLRSSRDIGERGAWIRREGGGELRSVIIGDYWNGRVLHYAEDGSDLGVLFSIVQPGMPVTSNTAPYGLAV